MASTFAAICSVVLVKLSWKQPAIKASPSFWYLLLQAPAAPDEEFHDDVTVQVGAAAPIYIYIIIDKNSVVIEESQTVIEERQTVTWTNN